MADHKLFVWRGSEDFEDEFSYLEYEMEDIVRPDEPGEIEIVAREARELGYPYFLEPYCPFCNIRYKYHFEIVPNPVKLNGPWTPGVVHAQLAEQSMQVGSPSFVPREDARCFSCGFWWQSQRRIQWGGSAFPDYPVVRLDLACLRRMSINDSRLGLNELGSHLRRNYKHVYALNWRRFEELVADVYRELGYQVRLTAPSRDDGYDIMLFQRSTAEQILVECKRFGPNRKVGIGVVDRLLGVQVRYKAPRAKLVTSSTFTSDAIRAAKQASEACPPFELELVDAAKLVTALGVYNTSLPPLDVHLQEHLRAGQGFKWPHAEPLPRVPRAERKIQVPTPPTGWEGRGW